MDSATKSTARSGRTAAIIAVVVVLVLILIWLRRSRGGRPACDASHPCPSGYNCVGGACEPRRCAELWPFARPTSTAFADLLKEAWAAKAAPVTPEELAVRWDPSWAPIKRVLAWVRAAAGEHDSPPCHTSYRPGRPSECQLRLFAIQLGWNPDTVCRPGSKNGDTEVCSSDCRWQPTSCTLAGQSVCYTGRGAQGVVDFERYEDAWPETHVAYMAGAPVDTSNNNANKGRNTWAVHALDVRPSLTEGTVALEGCEQACRDTPGCSGYSYDRARRWCALWPAPADVGVATVVTTTDFSGTEGSRPPATGYVYGLNRNWQAGLPAACDPATMTDASDDKTHTYGPQPSPKTATSSPPVGCWSTDLSAGEQVFTHGVVTGGTGLSSGHDTGTLLGCVDACRSVDGCKYWSVPQGNTNMNSSSHAYKQFGGWSGCNLYSDGTLEYGHDNTAAAQVQFAGEI